GLHLAISRDGLHWSPLRANRSVFAKPFAPVFRDPSLCRAPDGGIRMVWTTAWSGRASMGIATTHDLIHWTDVRELPVGLGLGRVLNVWAPELFFDGLRRRWIAHWSSSVEGRFPETKPPQPSWNNRVYCAESTDDCRSFGPARILFNEGFMVNDSFLLESPGDPRGRYCLIVKRVFSTPERHGQAARLYLTFADRPDGPFRSTGEPITGAYEFCEGPTVARIGGSWYCCFDLSKQGRMGCVRSRELKAGPWEDVTAEFDLPAGNHHGSLLPITAAEFRRLKEHAWSE
nr:hypothetical protein [Bryobacter sp.]